MLKNRFFAIAIASFFSLSVAAGCSQTQQTNSDSGGTADSGTANSSSGSATDSGTANSSSSDAADSGNADSNSSSAADSSNENASQPANQPPNKAIYMENGVAIAGTDPVAYFQEGKAVAGDSAFAHAWDGATWHFASAENRDRFAADPEKYAPQYGGYCAYAVSQGQTAPIDPEAWKIVDDKLYLNFDQNVASIWEKDIPGYIAEADENWPQIQKELTGG